MNTYIVHLYFKNALHIGASNAGIDIEATQDFIHSDTLWAVIANYWAIIGKVGEIAFEDFLNGFRTKKENKIITKNDPLFRISSAFPLTQLNDLMTYWLPKPLSTPMAFSISNIDNDERQHQRKEYGKNVKQKMFIPLDVYKEWINFEKNASDVANAEQKGISNGQLRPHATLDRLSMQAQLFHSGITYFEKFEKRVGLYFLIQCDEITRTLLEKIFQVIYEAGAIGGNRSIGLGALAEEPYFQKTDTTEFYDLFNTKNSNAHCLLSLCYPGKSEILNTGTAVAYNLVMRKGWTGSLSVGMQRKRQTVCMFSEGSVFKNKVNGSLVDITPDKTITPEWNGLHDVYRYGYALSVPIKIDFHD